MAKFFLINNVRVGVTQLYAGALIDDAFEDVAKMRAAGAVLVTNTNGPVARASVLAQKFRKRGAPPAELAEVMQSALDFTHERFPKGANITGTGGTIQWSDGLRRVNTALSGAGTITLGVAAGADGRLPTAGDRLEITRTDVTANTLAIVNGGPGAGTLCTLVASKQGFAVVEFDGTNWELVACSAT